MGGRQKANISRGDEFRPGHIRLLRKLHRHRDKLQAVVGGRGDFGCDLPTREQLAPLFLEAAITGQSIRQYLAGLCRTVGIVVNQHERKIAILGVAAIANACRDVARQELFVLQAEAGAQLVQLTGRGVLAQR